MKASRFAAFLGVVLVSALLASSNMAAADQFSGSAVKIYSKGYTHIDLGYYFNKAKDIFFSEEFIRKHPKAAVVQHFINTMGYFAISDYEVESRMANGRIWSKETVRLNQDYPDSLIYQMVQLPDRPFEIASLLTDEDYVALIAVSNFKEKAQLMFGHMVEAVSAFPGADSDIQEMKQALGMLQMLQVKPEVMGAMGDELDLVLFDIPDLRKPVNGPQDINAAILVPVADFEQAKNLVSMIGGFAGFDLSQPVFSTTEWKFYDIAGSGVGLGLSHDWLVVATNYRQFAAFARASTTKMHEDLPWGNCYFRINAQKLYDQLGRPALQMARRAYPKLSDDAMAYFFDITPETDFGEIEVLIQFDDDSIVSTSEMDDEIINGLLFFLAVGLETAVGQQVERQRQWKEKYRQQRKAKKDTELPEGKGFSPNVPF